MLLIQISGTLKSYYSHNKDFLLKLDKDIRAISQKIISSKATVYFTNEAEGSMWGGLDIICEIKYGPLPNRTYSKMQQMCLEIGESIRNSTRKFNEPGIRVFSTKLNLLEEGCYSNTEQKNKKENFAKNNSNGADHMMVFYSDDELKRYRLAFLLEMYLQHQERKEDEGMKWTLREAGLIQKEKTVITEEIV